MKLFVYNKPSLDIDETQFFILAKDKEDCQKQWYKLTKEKLLPYNFTEIPNIEKSNIFTFDKEELDKKSI